MSEKTIKSDVDEKNKMKEDDNTWNLVITHARKELSKCLDEIPLTRDDPEKMLKTLNRLKSLVDKLDKLVAVYDAFSELCEIVQEK